MPTFRNAAFLVRAIESVLPQLRDDYELLIGNNCSDDETATILQRYERHPRVRIKTRSSNLGPYGNLNKLIEEAEGELIKLICSDDWMLPGGLDAQVAFMEANPRLAFSRCLAEEDRKDVAHRGNAVIERVLGSIISPKQAPLVHSLLGNVMGSFSQIIFRRSLVIQEQLFTASVGSVADFEFWVRVGAKHPFGLQDEELVHVRSHPGQASHYLTKNNEKFVQMDAIHSLLLSQLDPSHHHSILRYWEQRFFRPEFHAALRLLSRGRFQPLRTFLRSRPYEFSALRVAGHYFRTLNGRRGDTAVLAEMAALVASVGKENKAA